MRRLRLRRILAGLSQVELAWRVGKSAGWMSLVERGYLRPAPDMLARLKASLKDAAEIKRKPATKEAL
jgi:transcriptional regulator with XRE-family HTH domain